MRDLVFALLATTVLTAACGGGDDAAAPTTTTSPVVVTTEVVTCPLDALTVNAVTGLEVGDPDPVIPTGDGVSCTFGATSGDTGIGVTIYNTTGAIAMETARGLFDDAEELTVDWADEAIWSPSLTTLHVVAGERGAQVQITDFGGAIAEPLQIALELAELALG